MDPYFVNSIKLRTLGTNQTNSAAISEDGKIYVWGLKKFGLVPDNKGSKSQYQTIPQELKLPFINQEESDEDNDAVNLHIFKVI